MPMDKKPHFLIEVKQVGNGFFLSINDVANYNKSESVHISLDEVSNAIDKVISFVKGQFLFLPPPIARNASPFENGEVPF